MSAPNRRVVASIVLSLDGYSQGPGGPEDMAWLMPHAVSEVSRDHLTAIWQTATTALLGRTNATGFFEYWPRVADDEGADPRDRGYGAWMRDAEKVVLSHTLTSAPWSNARIYDEPASDVVDRLRTEPGADIVVFSSASVISALLRADRVDRLALSVFPEILGGGHRFFERGLPASTWSLVRSVGGADGVQSLVYDRVRTAEPG